MTNGSSPLHSDLPPRPELILHLKLDFVTKIWLGPAVWTLSGGVEASPVCRFSCATFRRLSGAVGRPSASDTIRRRMGLAQGEHRADIRAIRGAAHPARLGLFVVLVASRRALIAPASGTLLGCACPAVIRPRKERNRWPIRCSPVTL